MADKDGKKWSGYLFTLLGIVWLLELLNVLGATTGMWLLMIISLLGGLYMAFM